jgi:hypothetical protein
VEILHKPELEKPLENLPLRAQLHLLEPPGDTTTGRCRFTAYATRNFQVCNIHQTQLQDICLRDRRTARFWTGRARATGATAIFAHVAEHITFTPVPEQVHRVRDLCQACGLRHSSGRRRKIFRDSIGSGDGRQSKRSGVFLFRHDCFQLRTCSRTVSGRLAGARGGWPIGSHSCRGRCAVTDPGQASFLVLVSAFSVSVKAAAKFVRFNPAVSAAAATESFATFFSVPCEPDVGAVCTHAVR